MRGYVDGNILLSCFFKTKILDHILNFVLKFQRGPHGIREHH